MRHLQSEVDLLGVQHTPSQVKEAVEDGEEDAGAVAFEGASLLGHQRFQF
jgi:hypothetical protein